MCSLQRELVALDNGLLILQNASTTFEDPGDFGRTFGANWQCLRC